MNTGPNTDSFWFGDDEELFDNEEAVEDAGITIEDIAFSAGLDLSDYYRDHADYTD